MGIGGFHEIGIYGWPQFSQSVTALFPKHVRVKYST
jgi:hypothetical protein